MEKMKFEDVEIVVKKLKNEFIRKDVVDGLKSKGFTTIKVSSHLKKMIELGHITREKRSIGDKPRLQYVYKKEC